MEKLALAIIAKDEVDDVKKIVARYIKYFDEIVVAFDSDKFSEREHGKVRFVKYEWCDDFAHKRNFLAKHINSNYYFRMDTDDEIINPEKIRDVFNRMCSSGIDVIYTHYLYDSDEDNNVNVSHWRETIIRKDPNFYWKKPVHENIFIEDQDKFVCYKENGVSILHNTKEGHVEKSNERNFKILIKEFEKDKDNCDIRTISYIGRTLLGWGHYEKAKHFLELLVSKSGWDDDKYFGWIHLGDCHRLMEDIETAIACCNEAMSINTEYPDAYFKLLELYIEKKDFTKAVHWGTVGLTKPKPDTMFIIDPTTYTYRPAINMAVAYFGLGDYHKAKLLMDKAKKLAPSNKFINSNYDMFNTAFENDKYYKNLMWLLAFLKENDADKITSLVESIPKALLLDERIQTIRHKFLPPVKWDDKSIVIFCGNTSEEWAAPSVITGIGGSEEAVIYISQELSKLGHSVTVFNNCGEMAGTYNGITYKPFVDFNPRDEYSTLISWRRDMFSDRITARKKILWLHDVPGKHTIKKECNFDHMLVLSEYHKTLLPDYVPEDKIVVSSNGINLKDFDFKVVPEREPHRMIYTSSYDRGIEHLLTMWKDVRKEVPDAELHLFYGWDVYDQMVVLGHRPREFRNRMTKLMNQPGVFEHGRIGHKQLNKEFLKSKFWVYPSHFEEISCISAMKAQACGCVPVIVNYAALKETVKDGVIVDGQAGVEDANLNYKNALVNALKEQPCVSIDKEQFGWGLVAKKWSELFV